jgi:hypothetical protein
MSAMGGKLTLVVRESMSHILLGTVAVALCSCSNGDTERTHPMTGLLFVMEGEASVLAWDERNSPLVLIPDNQNVVDQLAHLAVKNTDCYGALYEATWVIAPPKNYLNSFGHRVTKTPLLNIIRANLTERSEADLRPTLHRADLSASGICRYEIGSGAVPMTDTYVTGSRVQSS